MGILPDPESTAMIGLRVRLTTQAQRPGARDATMATATLPPGSLQRMVRPRFAHWSSKSSRSMIALSRKCQLAQPRGESPLTSLIVRSAPAANNISMVSTGA